MSFSNVYRSRATSQFSVVPCRGVEPLVSPVVPALSRPAFIDVHGDLSFWLCDSWMFGDTHSLQSCNSLPYRRVPTSPGFRLAFSLPTLPRHMPGGLLRLSSRPPGESFSQYSVSKHIRATFGVPLSLIEGDCIRFHHGTRVPLSAIRFSNNYQTSLAEDTGVSSSAELACRGYVIDCTIAGLRLSNRCVFGRID